MKKQFLLDPEVAYLNHGSYGACPRTVFEAYQKYQRELEFEPVNSLHRHFPEKMREARKSLASYLKCQTDDIAFVRNATYGLNMVARSLKIGPGDTILATGHEYGAVDRMWETLCAEAGAKLLRVKIPLPVISSDSVIELFASHVDPSVKAITFPHIAAEPAQLFPIKALVKLAADAGTISVVDGAHAPGQIPLNLNDLGADFYVGNCHKWMLSPKGAGFVYASPHYADLIRPPIISWGNISEGTSALLLENEWQGTIDISSILAVSDAITFLTENKWFEKVVPSCSALIEQFNKSILKVTEQVDLYHCAELRPPQMASFLLPEGNYSSLHSELYNRYKVEIPVFFPPQGTMFRVSVQAYNSVSDLERLTVALSELL